MNTITKTSPFESIVKELKVDAQGKGFVTLRGLSRLCGVRVGNWGRKSDRKFTIEIDEYLAQSEINVSELDFSNGIPDIVAAEVIGYYADEQNSAIAKQSSRALRAIGLRGTIQNLLGWKPDPIHQLTPQEFVELCCLPFATPWQKRFSEEYYSHLSRLTKLPTIDNRKPALFGALTKRFIYDYLPTGVYDKVRQCKAETGSYKKLHQFLSEHGIATLENQMARVLGLMQGAATIDQLETSLHQACTGHYQLTLMPSAPKVKELGVSYKVAA